jgi:hypothetical protein
MRRPPRFAPGAACTALALSAALLLGAATARANSVLSVGGLGEPTLEENARLRALGGAGSGERGPGAFSLVNPASIAEARFLTLEATTLASRRDISSRDFGSETATESSFPSVRLVVRLPGGTVLGGSYLTGTNAEFQVDRPESAGAASLLRIEGSGGINFARVTLARHLIGHLQAGADFEVIGGSYREEWRRVFLSNPNLAQARDTLEVDWDRMGRWRFGLQYVRPGIVLGGSYETGKRLPTTYLQRTAGARIKTTGQSLEIPSGYAAGFSLSLSSRARFVGQYRRQSWDDESLVSDLVGFRAMERYSVGFERAAAEFGGTFAKLPIRLGATLLKWPDLLPVAGAVDVSGGIAPVDEWAVSIGTGIVTPDRGAAFDVSIEGGTRGNEDELGVRETFIRAALSLRVSDETWK